MQDPILIDLAGDGFFLTDINGGVNFDFFGLGSQRRISWTKAGVQNAWLGLDLNQNGKIDNGKELFGNAMAAPGRSWKHLGFSTLALYDTQAFGGNADGAIDSRDAVFARLRLWMDLNHNGVTEPGELVTAQQAGIQAISLNYKDGHYTDAYGNQFRYRSQVTWQRAKDNGKQHWAYDVILLPSGK